MKQSNMSKHHEEQNVYIEDLKFVMNERDLIDFKLETVTEIASRLSIMYFSKKSDSLIMFENYLLDICQICEISDSRKF